MTKKLLMFTVGLSLILGACAVLSPEGEITEDKGLSAVIYKDPT